MRNVVLLGLLTVLFAIFFPGNLPAQSAAIPPAARQFIVAGNRAWINAMKSGDAHMVAMTYAADAVDCGPSGDCLKGRDAIEASLKSRIASLGRAISASVTSYGGVQRGNFIYEWGRASATFSGRRQISGPYLTVWQRQANGSWKIFRNMALPAAPGMSFPHPAGQ